MKRLNNVKILFLAWEFYQYPHIIEKKLVNMGAKVTYYSSAPSNNLVLKKVFDRSRFFRKKYFDSIINDVKGCDYDYVFVINSSSFPTNFLKKISELFSNSKKVLYCWDSLNIHPTMEDSFKYFDKIYSFDENDASRRDDLTFLPLFYSEKNDSDFKSKYDFSFVGFAHSERFDFIEKIKKFSELNDYTYNFNLYLPSLLHFFKGKYMGRTLSKSQLNDFVFHQVSYNTVLKIMEESRIIIDLQHSDQTGMTMRTIEAIGMKKKLITTNENIKNYDFYNSDNVLVVDRNKPEIDSDFVESPYISIEEKIYQKYSLRNWLNTIFNNGD